MPMPIEATKNAPGTCSFERATPHNFLRSDRTSVCYKVSFGCFITVYSSYVDLLYCSASMRTQGRQLCVSRKQHAGDEVVLPCQNYLSLANTRFLTRQLTYRDKVPALGNTERRSLALQECLCHPKAGMIVGYFPATF